MERVHLENSTLYSSTFDLLRKIWVKSWAEALLMARNQNTNKTVPPLPGPQPL